MNIDLSTDAPPSPGGTYAQEAAAELRKAREANDRRAALVPSLAAGNVPTEAMRAEIAARRMEIAEGFTRLAEDATRLAAIGAGLPPCYHQPRPASPERAPLCALTQDRADRTEKENIMITIYGASDDLVEVDGCEGTREFNADRWQGDLAPDGEAAEMRVHCWYDDDGCWQVGVGQVIEDHPLPSWPITITQAPAMNPANPGYSAMLSIDAPAGTRLVNVKPEPS